MFVDPPFSRPAFRLALEPLARGVARALCWLLAGVVAADAEMIPLKSVEASFQGGDPAALAKVIDGVEAGAEGWSVAPKFSVPHSLIVRCARPVEATELEITLFFLSGQPGASIAEFELAYTTDKEPSLKGKWIPLEVQRQAAKNSMLTLLPSHRRVRASVHPAGENSVVPGDVYRLGIQLPGGKASGFRLQVFPLLDKAGKPYSMGRGPQRDFVLTEFRVEEHYRATTNLALNLPVRSSHPAHSSPSPNALTDGQPSTFAHPEAGNLGAKFHFEIDLGRSAALDHITLRGRGDKWAGDRLSRVNLRLYEDNPKTGATPVWEGLHRADGSFPAPGEHDVIHAGLGKGDFRGRYLRLSSDSRVAHSPQFSEVEIYESRTPELVAVFADGRKIPVNGELHLPSGVDRLSVRLKIPQSGMPAGDLLRWRVRGGLEKWQTARTLTLDMPCPPRGTTTLEVQALHSDREWDATVFSLPIVRKHLWQTSGFQVIAVVATVLGSMSLTRFFTKRRSARKLALANSRAALAEERTRIARDLHDDLGANLASIGLLTEIAGRSMDTPDHARLQLEKIYNTADELTRQLRAVVWAVDPANDTLESFARYLHGHAEDYLGMAGIRCHFTSTEVMSEIHLPSSIRHPLLMISKEALHNIVKHATATVVTFRIVVEDRRLVIEIADNGCGMPPPEAMTPGNGLANMRSRAAAIGATCEILPRGEGGQPATLQASRKSGTIVRFILPLDIRKNGNLHPSVPPPTQRP